MSIKIKDLLPSDFLFNEHSAAQGILSFAISSIGVIPCIIVLVATRKNQTPRHILLFSLMASDLLVAGQILFLMGPALFSGKMPFGVSSCLSSMIISMLACIACVFSLLAITTERYMGIILRRDLTEKEAYQMTAGIWAISIFHAVFPFATLSYADSISLTSSKLYCFVSWTDRSPLTILYIVIILIDLGLAVSAVFYIYYSIIKQYRHRLGGVKKMAKTTGSVRKSSPAVPKPRVNMSIFSNGSPAKVNSSIIGQSSKPPSRVSKIRSGKSAMVTITDAEKKLLIRAVTLVGAFLTSWSFQFVVIMYQLLSGKQSGSWLDVIAGAIVLFNSAINPLILIRTDAGIRQDFWSFLGFA